MSTKILTGRRRDLPQALLEEAAALLKYDGTSDVFVIVPNQLTLETERQLFEGLHLTGSFRLNVVSPKRFCGRVFDFCGHPSVKAVDEQGRAVLMGYLLRKNAKQLKWFQKAASRTGFEMQLVDEITRFKQAGVEPEELAELARNSQEASLRAKLEDLSLLYDAYREQLSGVFQDGEDEITEAVSRMAGSSALKSSSALIYGFDITTASVNKLIAGVSSICRETRILLPLPGGDRRDRSIYLPMEDALGRLREELDRQNVCFETVLLLENTDGIKNVQRIADELYCAPVRKVPNDPGFSIRILKNPLEESAYVAASIREMVRTKGWRYSDITVITDAEKEYSDMLSAAFRDYGVPYFSQEVRSALTQPLCIFLNETLALVCGKAKDITEILMTGFTGLNDDESEALISYAKRMSLRPSAILKTFTRGDAKMLAESEPARKKLAEPVLGLKERLKSAESLRQQLSAVYEYLLERNCFDQAAQYRKTLIDLGETALAADDVRVNNMLVGLFDQMLTLLPDRALPLTVLADLIRRGVNVEIMKLLPQSPDSVTVCSAQRAGMRPMKAVFLMHAAAETAESAGGILDEEETRSVSQRSGRYLAPDSIALARTKRMYNKDALCLAGEYICITCPAGDMEGTAILTGSLIKEARRICAGLDPQGGATSEPEDFKRLRLTSAEGALAYLTGSFEKMSGTAEEVTAARYLNKDGHLQILRKALNYKNRSDRIDTEIARALYGSETSITRLETYAGCPFSHFVKHGLRPEEERPYGLDPLNRGTFLHKCMERFSALPGIACAGEEEAVGLMNGVAEKVLAEELSAYTADSAAARAEVCQLTRAARRAASILWRQLQKGVFRPVRFEMNFGREKQPLLSLSEDIGVNMTGKVDRVDLGSCDGNDYAFVVDYKSSAKSIEPADVYAGLQLQLLVYLYVVCRKFHTGSAGVYYFTIADEPVVSDSRDPAVIEKEQRADDRMTGIAVADEKVLYSMADEPDKLLKILITPGNKLRKDAIAATQEEFNELCSHVIARCEEFARGIYEGNTELSPSLSPATDACRYCTYSGICMKDRLLGPRKRIIRKMKFDALCAKVTGKDIP